MTDQSRDRATLIGALLLVAIVLAATLLGARILRSQGPAERGAFLVRRGADTVVVERFARSGDSITGTLSVRGQPRVEYVARLGPADAVRTFSVNAYRADAPVEEGPVTRVVLTFRGDSAIAEVNGAAQRLGTKPGALPFLNNSFAMFELFTRRARAAGGTTDIPALALSGGVTLMVSFRPEGADSLVATISGQEQRIRADASGRLLGATVARTLEILRITEAEAAGVKVARPSYAPPAGAPYTAEDVALRGQGGIPLGGTLTLPKGATGRVPAVVTITGSGQQDRDELIPLPNGGYRPFRQVADTLGRRGIAVLRLDDRTIGASGGKTGTSADYAEDIRAALAYLRTRPEVDAARLGLLGHSEGGLIGPMVAAAEPGLGALVALAGPADNGLEIIKFQQRYAIDRDTSIKPANREAAYRDAEKALDSLVAASPWHKFFVSYDPLRTARRVKAPTLILQGGTDQQVTAEQAEKLGAAIRAGGNRDVTVRVFPQMNHLFIHDPDGSPSGYAQLKVTRMSSEVLGVLADWLASRLLPTANP